MRKKLLAFLLVIAMMTGVAMPAGAYQLADYGDYFLIEEENETNQFWSEHGASLQERGIYTHTYSFDYIGDFSDGFLPIFYSAGGDLLDDYVDKNGNLADLNQGRYSMMHAFSEGLAAASPQKNSGHTFNGLCYVDTNGNQVIKESNEWLPLMGDASTFVGHFKNGKAVVIRESLSEKYSIGRAVFSDNFRGLYYAYIDKNGKYISEWTYTDSWDEVCKLPLYNNLGVWIGHSSLADLSKVDINAWNNSQGQQTEPDAAQTPARQWSAPALPEYNQNAPSLFASTGKVTGFYLGDMDFGTVKITITNPGSVTDAGVIAAVFVNADLSSNNRAGCFFVPYELGAGESREYSVEMTHIFNQNMFDVKSGIKYAQQLEGAVDAAIITFEGHEDLVSFYNTVPYEQNWQPTTLVSDFQHICDAEAGDAWLRMIGMPRISPYLIATGYPQTDGSSIPGADADHSFCAR